MNILVTGGAGYIGAHTCKALKKAGHQPFTVDNLIYGHKSAVRFGPFYKVDLHETEQICEIINHNKIEAVIHFAAFAYVGESVKLPLKYYENNLNGTLSLLRGVEKTQVRKIVFSSTCATYGVPSQLPIREETEQKPINPYGRSKLMIENILRDLDKSINLKSISLRYFNACGADLDGELGEQHDPETHLIPLAIEATRPEAKPLTVFGQDYQTPDGTCIRDYIHVCDLASAHVQALEYLIENNKSEVFNLGTGRGTSVKEIISMVKKVAKRPVNVVWGEKRAGDPPELVADPSRAQKILTWQPKHSSLETIVETAYRWHEKLW